MKKNINNKSKKMASRTQDNKTKKIQTTNIKKVVKAKKATPSESLENKLIDYKKVLKGQSQENFDRWILTDLKPQILNSTLSNKIKSQWGPDFAKEHNYKGKPELFRGLHIVNPTNIDWLSRQQFSNLIVKFSKHTSDLEHLTQFPNIAILSLCHSRAKDFFQLGHFLKLVELDLWEAKINDLQNFEKLKNLRFLQLYRTQVRDLSPLANLLNLTSLSVCKVKTLTSLKPLSKLKNLKFLNISSTSVQDLSELNKLKLENLWARDLKLKTIEPLFKMKSLKYLDLVGCRISASDKTLLQKSLVKTEIRF